MKIKKEYICKECNYKTNGWMGRCPNCGAWDSIEEKILADDNKKTFSRSDKGKSNNDIKKLKDIKIEGNERYLSGISEFDRTIGLGLVKDSVTILTAVPGAGKSTLILELSICYASKGLKVLYISGEESASQIKSRAMRINPLLPENIWIVSTSILDDGLNAIEKIDPDIIFLDSIQTVRLLEFNSKTGSPVQTVECTSKIIDICKNPLRPRACIMVGHMTKNDEMAGLRTLEHMVDTVIILREDLDQNLRMLYSTKNRFGRSGEVGIFRMQENGLKEVLDLSSEFLNDKDKPLEGSSISIIKEGSRNIAVEIESLVSKSFDSYPLRTCDQMSKDRLLILTAILEKRAFLQLYDKNIVVKSRGGLSLRNEEADLGILIAISSSLLEIKISPRWAFIGEVGLTGELKKIRDANKKIEELDRMGFKKVFVPKGTSTNLRSSTKIEILEFENFVHVLDYLKNTQGKNS